MDFLSWDDEIPSHQPVIFPWFFLWFSYAFPSVPLTFFLGFFSISILIHKLDMASDMENTELIVLLLYSGYTSWIDHWMSSLHLDWEHE